MIIMMIMKIIMNTPEIHTLGCAPMASLGKLFGLGNLQNFWGYSGVGHSQGFADSLLMLCTLGLGTAGFCGMLESRLLEDTLGWALQKLSGDKI